MQITELNISTRQVRAFLALAQHRNFTRAAQQSHLSQSAFSTMIRTLEEAVGLRLFDRDTRKVDLTPEGELFRQGVSRLMEDFRATMADLGEHAARRRGRARIAALPSLAAGWLPGLLAEFHRRHPGIALAVSDELSESRIERVRSGRADFALAAIRSTSPELRADPSYLDRQGYETSINGQTVSSSSIDWNSTDSVDVRQPPGRGNALGQLKIMFPNSHAIYMHDTPQKKFFDRDMRALSHGCVRLSDPKKMAAAVMNMTIPEIEAEIATGQNHQVKVPEKFPVYVSYFTAFPNKDGVVEYFDDVYSRDAYMDKAFAATAKARGAES